MIIFFVKTKLKLKKKFKYECLDILLLPYENSVPNLHYNKEFNIVHKVLLLIYFFYKHCLTIAHIKRITGVYLVDDLVRLFHEKLIAYDFDLGLTLFSASTYHFQPFFSQKLMASALLPNSIFMFDNGSPLQKKIKY